MHISFAALARGLVGQSMTDDADLLASDPADALETPAFGGAGLGALCPDLVHEAQFGIGRRD